MGCAPPLTTPCMNTRLILEEQTFGQRLSDMREQVTLHGKRRTLNVIALVAGDVIALAGSLLLAGGIRLFIMGDPAGDPVVLTWTWGLLPLYVIAAAFSGLYPGWGVGVVEELRRSGILLFSVFGIIIAVLFLTQQGAFISRMLLGVSFVVALAAVPLIRSQVKDSLITAKVWGVPTVIYGAGTTGRRVVDILHNDAGLGFTPTALFDDNSDLWGEKIEGIPVLGSTRLVTSDAPVAILAIPSMDREGMVELLEGPLACYRTVILVPDLADAPSLWVRPRDIGGMLSLEISSNLTSPFARITKRSTDLVSTLITLPVWGAICAVLAAMIWLEDRHSPIFAQERIGLDGERFRTLKFRTMVPNAEAVLHHHLQEDAALLQEWETHYKLKNDPRITRIGKLLRRFSLDELPQLINVLRGEMSLVGPRPLPRYHHDELPLRVRELRERVRPGLTGIWQISGRSDSGTAGMERWDPYYVRNWSPWLDVVVLARTVRTVVRGTGAY